MTYQLVVTPRTGRETWTPYATEGDALDAARHEAAQPNRVHVAVLMPVDGRMVMVWERNVWEAQEGAA